MGRPRDAAARPDAGQGGADAEEGSLDRACEAICPGAQYSPGQIGGECHVRRWRCALDRLKSRRWKKAPRRSRERRWSSKCAHSGVHGGPRVASASGRIGAMTRYHVGSQRKRDRPDWATRRIRHPAQLYPERSPERDAFEILLRCENVRGMIKAGADATLVDRAIDLGMLMGRIKFEAQFGRACDIGIGRILSGVRAAGRTPTPRNLRESDASAHSSELLTPSPRRPFRLGARQWLRLARFRRPRGCGEKILPRHKDQLRHEILMS